MRFGEHYHDCTLQEEGITKLLMAPADLKDEIPGISGTRALNDNLSDMKAQVASNFKGIGLVTALIEEYTLEVVQAYMHHIQVGSPNKYYVTQALFNGVLKGTRPT